MNWVERKVRIANRRGLHARPAGKFAETAAGFKSDILISNGVREINGKSILEIMMLAASKNATLTLRARGPDAERAVSVLAGLLRRDFGEEE